MREEVGVFGFRICFHFVPFCFGLPSITCLVDLSISLGFLWLIRSFHSGILEISFVVSVRGLRALGVDGASTCSPT